MQLHFELDHGALEAAGRKVAAVLQRSWRAEPPALESSLELQAVVPLLLRSGTAALAWWRASGGGSRAADSRILQDAYRQHAIHAAVHEQQIQAVFGLLGGAGVDAVLGKGWAIARQYPDPALRPYGDLDLYVPEAHYARTQEVLAAVTLDGCPVDLHRSFVEIGRRDEEVLAATRVVVLEGIPVRIFGPEDHLRLLALHLLRHGGWRPLWLCDIAIAIESGEDRLDWDRLLRGDDTRRDWIAATVVLARDLLGADLHGPPAEVTGRSLPRWLAPTVLRQWGDLRFVPHGTRTPIAHLLGQPRALWSALHARWPNGVEATVGVRGPFNELPRLPFQVAESMRRSAVFMLRLRQASGGVATTFSADSSK